MMKRWPLRYGPTSRGGMTFRIGVPGSILMICCPGRVTVPPTLEPAGGPGSRARGTRSRTDRVRSARLRGESTQRLASQPRTSPLAPLRVPRAGIPTSRQGKSSISSPAEVLCRSRESHIHNALSTDSANHVALRLVRAVMTTALLLYGVGLLQDALWPPNGIHCIRFLPAVC